MARKQNHECFPDKLLGYLIANSCLSAPHNTPELLSVYQRNMRSIKCQVTILKSNHQIAMIQLQRYFIRKQLGQS